MVCEDVSTGDHRRCLTRIALWKFFQLLWGGAAFVLFLTGVIALSDGFILSVFEVFAFLAVFTGLGMGVAYAMLLGGAQGQSANRTAAGAIPAMAILATRDTLYQLTNDTRSEIPWALVRKVREVDGDLLILWGNGINDGGWLYLPRRAFSDAAAARRFGDALRALAVAKGDPSVLPADISLTFPPPGAME